MPARPKRGRRPPQYSPPIKLLVVAPSILSADLGRLDEEVRAVDAAGAGWIHADVMDGRFVLNISLGPVVIEAVRRATARPLTVHLMIIEPERHLQYFALAGADHLLIQCEPSSSIHLGIDRFGASAPAEVLLTRDGFTVGKVMVHARRLDSLGS